ncbi:hypothetical protein [Aquabacterium sp.]|uniref:hypothetical protein n=1 Tax=Aquabacterium sp. TaxID=1872578 RepID=UPI002B867A40|nr:hypothetical protein [Aquabacterium sp.]HSW03918.1 hypothetical protein [Aquabacterium sp.]
MRLVILITSLVVAALFASALAASFINPLLVESAARELIRREVEQRVGQRLEQLDNSRLADAARRMLGRNEAEIAQTRRKLSEGLPRRVADVAAKMRNIDCECRQKIEQAVTEQIERDLARLSNINERLTTLIQAKYMEVAASLTREFRIFTAANALVFALLSATACFRRRAGLQLLLPAVVLVGAAGIVGGLYLFGQDWLHTLVFSDYVGLGYFAYLGLAMLLLADIVFNRARITTRIVNASFSALGSAVQVLPC